MPSSVAELLESAALDRHGVVPWQELPRLTDPGVYLVSVSPDLRGSSGAIPACPVDPAQVARLLDARPELLLDRSRPSADGLADRLRSFWLPDEPIIYVGMTSIPVRDRVSAYYRTRIGARSPHAGGWFSRMLDTDVRLFVHYARAAEFEAAEQTMLNRFAQQVSASSRLALHDRINLMPFANLERRWKGRRLLKDHGITGATG